MHTRRCQAHFIRLKAKKALSDKLREAYHRVSLEDARFAVFLHTHTHTRTQALDLRGSDDDFLMGMQVATASVTTSAALVDTAICEQTTLLVLVVSHRMRAWFETFPLPVMMRKTRILWSRKATRGTPRSKSVVTDGGFSNDDGDQEDEYAVISETGKKNASKRARGSK
jgi:hypothetical protein